MPQNEETATERAVATDHCREQVLAWLEALPDEARRTELAARLRTDEEIHRAGAVLEIAVDALFRQRGWSVAQPEPTAGRRTRMDFVVDPGSSGRFLCEATVVSDPRDDRLQRKRLDDLRAGLRQVTGPYEGTMFVRPPIPDGLRDRAVRAFLRRRLEERSADQPRELELHYFDAPGDEHPRITFRFLRRDRADLPVVLGWGWSQAQMIGTAERIRDALEYKSSRYGELDAPYLIA